MLTTRWWLIVKKQEMTRVWNEDRMVPVTILAVPEQTILRHKTVEKDGYSAIVIGADKKRTGKYGKSVEFKVSEDDLASYPVWSVLNAEVLKDVATVRVVWISKWKWFQGWMKRHNFWWWPKTHGSKFHRALGSTGNRKPRRTLKGQKMAWHMGDETITLKSVPVISFEMINEQQVVILKWSVPWAYHTYLELLVTEK